MRIRRLVLCAIAVSLAATGATASASPAKSKPKPCFLLTDDPGDGNAAIGGPVVASPALDILSADVASGARTVVVVLRLTTTDISNDRWATLGMSWAVNTSVGGKSYTFRVTRPYGPSNTLTATVVGAPDVKAVTLRVDPTSYTWTVARSAIDYLKPHGTILLESAATALTTSNADGALAHKPYVDRSVNCVKAA